MLSLAVFGVNVILAILTLAGVVAGTTFAMFFLIMAAVLMVVSALGSILD